MLTTMVMRAVGEANLQTTHNGGYAETKVLEIAHDARDWFAERSTDPFGWGYVAEKLELSDGTIKRFEELAFSTDIGPRPSGVLEELDTVPRKRRLKGTLRQAAEVSDEQWKKLQPLVDQKAGRTGPRLKYTRREILNAMLSHRVNTWGRKAHLPIRVPYYQLSNYKRLWIDTGVWPEILRVLPDLA